MSHHDGIGREHRGQGLRGMEPLRLGRHQHQRFNSRRKPQIDRHVPQNTIVPSFRGNSNGTVVESRFANRLLKAANATIKLLRRERTSF